MSQSQLSAESKRRLKVFGGLLLGVGGLYYIYYKYYYNTNNQKTGCCAETKLCCNGNETVPNQATDYKLIVNQRYSATARNLDSTAEADKLQSIAKVFGYTQDELLMIGSDANLGLSCGNPVKQANLKKGEIVLDLGCGAGMDLFLAKKYIGDSTDNGELLGVDFSKDMIAKAIKNAKRKQDKRNMDISNMKFMHSDIENMQNVIKNDYVDCVISNCVINLIPNKLNAFKEVYRVLKSNGGRICLSDIALKKELPVTIKNDITGFVNCISGAILATKYEQLLLKAGFKNVELVNKNVDLNIWKEHWDTMVGCCDNSQSNNNACCTASKPKVDSCCGGGSNDNISLSIEEKQRIEQVLKETDLNDYIASYYVFGFK